MKLERLDIRNFKGIKSFSLGAGGGDVTVYGDNATGKTTLADSICYLLFDKDSLWQGAFEIKPIGTESSPTSAIECEVTGQFSMPDGKVVSLGKIYSEKYTKKRGSLEAELTGHTTAYTVDGVPTTAGEYKQLVDKLAGSVELFRLLTSPTYFSEQLHWTKRREMLLALCPDITDEQVIAFNPDLAGLPAVLDGKSCDDRKKILTAQKKKIQDDIASIPARIDEQDRSRVTLEVTLAQTAIDKLVFLRDKLATKNEELATAKVGGGAAEIQNRLTAIDGGLEIIRQKHQRESGQASNDQLKLVNDLQIKQAKLIAQQTAHKLDVATMTKAVDNLNQKTAVLRQQYKDISLEKFVSMCCPTCGQDLPEGQKDEAQANYNTAKSTALEENKKAGKANVEAIAGLTTSINTVTELLAETEREAARVAVEIEALQQGVVTPPACEELPEYIELLATKAPIQAELDGINTGSSLTIDRITAEQTDIEALIAAQESALAAIEADNKITDRITELKESEKSLAREFEKVDRGLFMIETFTRAKVSLLEQSIDSKFRVAKFKLFQDQINGGITETCEVMVDGVPYGSLNNGAKIQVGMDIISTLADAKDFHPPVIIDNRESVTTIPEMKCQVINLVVSEADKTLRVA